MRPVDPRAKYAASAARYRLRRKFESGPPPMFEQCGYELTEAEREKRRRIACLLHLHDLKKERAKA